MCENVGSARRAISGLLIPATAERPLQRITIRGLADLRKAVGGNTECLHYRAATCVCVYMNASGRFTQPRNSRAVWQFRTTRLGRSLIAGDVVVVGVNANGLNTDLPAGYEQEICPPSLPDPNDVAIEHGAVRYKWQIKAGEPQARYVSLLACYRAADMARGPRLAAMLLCERDRNDNGGGRRVVNFGRLHVHYRGEVTLDAVQPFAEWALAALRMLYSEGEPKVTSYFA